MCIFCEMRLDQKTIILENEYCFSIFDEYPVSMGHQLIIIKRHVVSFFDLTKNEVKGVHQLLHQLKDLLVKQFNPDGFNIGVNDGLHAGQTIMHCHIHLIPRYKHDVDHPEGGVRGVIPSKQKYKR